MQIDGKDNDEEGTINSQISYRIVSQEPEGTHMFSIDETTGKLYVKEDTLDREVVPSVFSSLPQLKVVVCVCKTNCDGNN